MRILIRVSGDIRRPLLDADSIEVEGGRITAVGKVEAHPRGEVDPAGEMVALERVRFFAKPASASVDLEAARRLAAGDEELRAEVAAMFVESSRRHRAELRDAVQATDCAAIEEIAHALKGSAAVVGATAVQAVPARLEALSRDSHADRLATLAGELDREPRRAADFLAAQPSPKAT
jgi:HPt (histidine-containing phosphotransfer) domain-containing protein